MVVSFNCLSSSAKVAVCGMSVDLRGGRGQQGVVGG